jgi:hypothetical protein
LLQEVLAVLTDTMHKSGFKIQATILLALIHGVEGGGNKETHGLCAFFIQQQQQQQQQQPYRYCRSII